MKRLVSFSCVLILILSGCTEIVVPEPKPFPEIPHVEDIPFPAPHGVITTADTKPTWITNNISDSWLGSIQEETPEGVKLYIHNYTYSGLKDEAIMASINQAIQDKVVDLKKYAKFENIPVTPGFFAAFPEGQRDILNLNISVYATFNSANIMSVGFYVNVNFKPLVKDVSRDVGIEDALNFDLTTGQQLTLSDLFVNDSDFEGRLNELILLKSQGLTDPNPPDLQGWTDSYLYHGGFKGLRGDVKFQLGQSNLYLILNEKYTEFSNEYSSVQITIPFSQLADILSIGQRFTQNPEWIYTNPVKGVTRNYLYVITTTEKTWDVNGISATTNFTRDEILSDFYKAIAEKAFAKDLAYINGFSSKTITNIRLTFTASAMGPYMNLSSAMYLWGENSQIRGWRGTYKPDGTKFTMKDIFKDGFDYRAYIKGLIAEQIRDNQFTETYDLDVVYEQLASTLTLWSYGSSQTINMSNEFFFDASLDEGDFYITLDLDANQNILKLQHWSMD